MNNNKKENKNKIKILGAGVIFLVILSTMAVTLTSGEKQIITKESNQSGKDISEKIVDTGALPCSCNKQTEINDQNGNENQRDDEQNSDSVSEFWSNAWNRNYIPGDYIESSYLYSGTYKITEKHLDGQNWVSGGTGIFSQVSIYYTGYMDPDRLIGTDIISVEYSLSAGFFLSDTTGYSTWLAGSIIDMITTSESLNALIPGETSASPFPPPGGNDDDGGEKMVIGCPTTTTLTVGTGINGVFQVHVDVISTDNSVTVGQPWTDGSSNMGLYWVETSVTSTPPDSSGCVHIVLKARDCSGLHIGDYQIQCGCGPWSTTSATVCPCDVKSTPAGSQPTSQPTSQPSK